MTILPIIPFFPLKHAYPTMTQNVTIHAHKMTIQPQM